MKEKKPYQQQHWKHVWKGVAKDVSNKARGMHLRLVGNGFNHEIWAVADVSGRSEKNGTDADGDDEVAESGVAQKIGDLNLPGIERTSAKRPGRVLLQDANR